MTQHAEQHFDIAIAGGGMVGASLALAAARALDCRVVVIEAFPPQSGGYQPSFDARSTALSLGTREIFEQIGLWQGINARAEPIRHIHVSQQGHLGRTWMDSQDEQLPALGYVVENQALGQALWQALSQEPRIQVIAPAKVESARIENGGARLQLDQARSLYAPLLVIADGARSPLCQRLGIQFSERPYGQLAVVANIATERPHQGVAFERFGRRGPLAMLPLPDLNGEHRSALVWTRSASEARALLNASEREFLAELQQVFGQRLGRLLKVGERANYPLALVQSSEQVRRHLAVLGNAAHLLHPVAGQGFNLALRDVAALVHALQQGLQQGHAIGALAPLLAYEAAQRGDQQEVIRFSDALPRLFGIDLPMAGHARGAGLMALEALPHLKSTLVHRAAGLRWPQFGAHPHVPA